MIESLQNGFPSLRLISFLIAKPMGTSWTVAISVVFTSTASDCKLMVSDEGKGLPPDFDVAAQNGLGMKIVDVLAQQLGGSVVVAAPQSRSSGRGLTVTFPRNASLESI